MTHTGASETNTHPDRIMPYNIISSRAMVCHTTLCDMCGLLQYLME